jgi:hypothetical protein
MSYLIDTNVFLRAAKRNDPDRQLALDAFRKLRANKEEEDCDDLILLLFDAFIEF